MFTKHVLQRMEERRISPMDVFHALLHIKPGQLGTQKFKRKVLGETMLICVEEGEYRRTILTLAFEGPEGKKP